MPLLSQSHGPQSRWVILAVLAFSPLGWLGLIQEAIAAPRAIVVPTIPIDGPSRPNSSALGSPSSVVIPTVPASQPGSFSTTNRPTNRPSNRPTNRPIYSTVPQLPNSQFPDIQLPSAPTPFTLVYRVFVLGDSDDVQDQVQTLVPGAFRTTISGQRVIQAGIFREQSKATELQQILSRNNLQVMVLPMKASESNISPTPRPDAPSVPTRPIPKTGVRVVIDPGHGGNDPGAIGIGGLREAELTLDVSRQVVSLLKQQGLDVIMTRQRNEEIDLSPRVQFADSANADVFVSIHANSFDADRTDVSGVESYYYSGSEGQRLARAIQDSLLGNLNVRDRGVKQANFYVIKYTSMPAALVEIGFVTGQEDAMRLSTASGRTRTAQAIAQGILQYLR